MKKYIPSEIEPKWQKKWREDRLYNPDMNQAKKPYFVLMMFPYPSAEGLHVGNMYPFTGTDIFARFKRMRGFDVFEPIGLDGFGIHSENYALKINEHPMEVSKRTEKRFYEQLMATGNAFDWDRTVETYKSNYYKWTQWLFLQMFKKGLAYRKKASVNWCPSCKTVLADEQVIAGVCERCGTTVEKRELEQWFFKITDYADRLLSNLDHIDWSEKVKIAQRNWIGRSEGALIEFKIQNVSKTAFGRTKFKIEVFSTALDTIFGVTFMVLSPQHPVLKQLEIPLKQKKLVEEYIKRSQRDTKKEDEEKEKSGAFTGLYVINPFNQEEVPLWIADYVLMEYGTGAVMGVPGHDVRDYEFAKKFKLPIKPVIKPAEGVKGANINNDGFWDYPEIKLQFAEKSILFESGGFSGLTSKEAKEKMIVYIEKEGVDRRQVNYHLRDWLISRQRYWGPPIPIIYCHKCGVVPVPEEDLPVELPFIEEFRPTGTGQSPLAADADFVNVSCPRCGNPAKRETDVSDTFLDSAWYFLRYPSTEFDNKAFDEARTKKWLPVDMYIGGAEHSVLHLLYARFITMVLKDLGRIEFEEPFDKFRAHGLIIKEGAKMSKSKGNTINPDKYISDYGVDTLRMYLMFMGPFSEGGDFRDAAVGGLYRFLNRVWQSVELGKEVFQTNDELKIVHKTVKKVGEDIENLHFNTAIASLMELINFIFKQKQVSKETLKTLLLLLAPFAPHMTEELWSFDFAQDKRNWSIHQQSWPEFDSRHLEEVQVKIVVQVNGKVRDTISIEKDIEGNKSIVEKKALESKQVQKFMVGKEPKKVIYVPGRLINFVV